MRGIVSYGSYVPRRRLARSTIGAALGVPSAPGTRAVAAHDEDSVSMAVEAGRVALATCPVEVDSVLFATTTPPYLDKTNATVVRGALGLGARGLAADVGGSCRSAFAALLAGLWAPRPALVACADLRTGLPGSNDEREGGDAAAAFVLGDADADAVLAELLGHASTSIELLDRWREPGALHADTWEERFGDHVYRDVVEPTVVEALKAAGVEPGDVDHVVVTGTHARAVRQAKRALELPRAIVADELLASVGQTGAAHPGLLLAAVLDRAVAGEVIAVVLLADGVDVAVLRTTSAIEGYTAAATVAEQVDGAGLPVDYATFLTWRGFLERSAARRPEPDPPAGPPSWRAASWKLGFRASRCNGCGTRHLPPQRVCLGCRAHDDMTDEPLGSVPATIATCTVDHLAPSPCPPVGVAVLDFDGGGRFLCELTDVDAESVAVGDRVEMTFRRTFTANGVHNYFWKARPVREAS